MSEIISGWAGYPQRSAKIVKPTSIQECAKQLGKPFIPRGKGRSYGDSANAETVLQSSWLDHYISFDKENGLLTCEAGVTLRKILELIVPLGWFVPVTPGTSYVTIGGAIASDVHGKNHHLSGTFCAHVQSMAILIGTSEIVVTSPTKLPDLFHATCGGMGLTGMILTATIKLIPIRSTFINQTTIKTGSIEAACESFEANSHATYSVAWIDCVSTGRSLGRNVLTLGEHSDEGGREFKLHDPIYVPFHTPSVLLNKLTVNSFNALYYAKAKHNKSQRIPLLSFFYPLDAIGGWNKLYGKPGFVQYQCVVPKERGVENMRAVLEKIADSGMGSFLAVLKQFGPQNNNLLSFPMQGYTLALDFKYNDKTTTLLNELDKIIVDMGGRLYLTKDALMTEETFKSTYPRWEAFENVRAKYGAIGKFVSDQSKRLGLQ